VIPVWATLVYATTLAVAAFIVTLLLNLHDRPFLLPMIAVLLSAIQGGFPAGLLAGLVTILLANYYLVPPANAFGVPSLEEAYQLVVFGFTAGMISWLAARRRGAELALAMQADDRANLLERERTARAELEQANRIKDEFLATLSHELRTPLNAVLGWAQILRARPLDPPRMRQALDAIYRNAQAQTRLVDEILDLSRIVTGRLSLTAEEVDVADVIRHAMESFAPAMAARRQRVERDLAPGILVTGDEHRLGQVMWNLMSNAAKFTPDGGTIRVSARAERGHAIIEVQDTGEGIDPALLPHVFERFRQGDSSSTRMHGGLGLGLSLVHFLVEAHAGEVNIRSDGRGKGTTVTVRLPLRSATPLPRPKPHLDTTLAGLRERE
jgi:signal transduction histidine kinase